jgi:hypothetical protein
MVRRFRDRFLSVTAVFRCWPWWRPGGLEHTGALRPTSELLAVAGAYSERVGVSSMKREPTFRTVSM